MCSAWYGRIWLYFAVPCFASLIIFESEPLNVILPFGAKQRRFKSTCVTDFIPKGRRVFCI